MVLYDLSGTSIRFEKIGKNKVHLSDAFLYSYLLRLLIWCLPHKAVRPEQYADPFAFEKVGRTQWIYSRRNPCMAQTAI